MEVYVPVRKRYGRVSGIVCCSFGDLMNGMREISHVVGRDTGHRDAAIFGQVHAEFLGEALHLKGNKRPTWSQWKCDLPLPDHK